VRSGASRCSSGPPGRAREGRPEPSHDEAEADQAGGEPVEAFQDVEPALVADGEPAETGEPRQRPLDDPAVAAEPLGTVHPAPRDARDDAPLATGAAAAGVIVAFVGVQLARALARPTGALPDRRHGIEQGLEHQTVVHVRGAEQERERDAASIDDPASTITWRLVPSLPRSVGFGPVSSPPFSPGRRRCRASSGRSRPRSHGRAGRGEPGAAVRRPSRPASRAAGASRSCRSRTRGARPARAGLWLVHGGFRHPGLAGREGVARWAPVTSPRWISDA
jgi:hypothetical protein